MKQETKHGRNPKRRIHLDNIKRRLKIMFLNKKNREKVRSKGRGRRPRTSSSSG